MRARLHAWYEDVNAHFLREKDGGSIATVILLTALALAVMPVDAALSNNQQGIRAVPDLTQGGKPDATHDWTLGPTGAHGWIYGALGQTSDARQILITSVDKGSPADGILTSGDVILGISDQPFNADARIQMAKAIAAAEQDAAGGGLRLIRWRAGESRQVELQLAVMGTYSETAPYDCPKSKKIFELGCQAIARKGLDEVSIPNDLNALALLASGAQQ